jgi:hypothetical protein
MGLQIELRQRRYPRLYQLAYLIDGVLHVIKTDDHAIVVNADVDAAALAIGEGAYGF